MNWFISINEDITGPFNTNKVLELKSDANFDSSEALVWGSLLVQWIKYDNWVKSHQDILNNKFKTKTKNQIWYFAENSQSKPVGPFSKLVLISQLAELDDKDKVLIWAKGMEAWASLFEFNDILESLNISRRKHPRAPISGQAILKAEDGQTLIGKIDIISPGGCGVSNIPGLEIGQVFQIEIKSPDFYNSISAIGKILHKSDVDAYGIKFEKIHVESKSTIISYLKEQGYINKTASAA